jgi:hypothetical protein
MCKAQQDPSPSIHTIQEVKVDSHVKTGIKDTRYLGSKLLAAKVLALLLLLLLLRGIKHKTGYTCTL